MKSCPKITVVTPSYNQGHFLEQTIDSVLSQGYPHLEYIVIDGGSTDHSVEIIKKYEKYLAYWVSEKDQGQSHAINKGFSRATGEVFNWLNSDDYYLPNALHAVGDGFSDPTVNVLMGRSEIIKDGSRVKISSGTDMYEDNLEKTIAWARIDQPETFFRKSSIDEIGIVNPDLHYVMDKDLWIRYLCRFGLSGIKRIPNTLVAFRLHATSKTSAQQKGFEQETNSLIQRFLELHDLKEMAAELAAFELRDSKIGMELKCRLTQGQARRVFHYFLMLKAIRAYAFNDFDLAKKALRKIDPSYLANEDRLELKKISQRMHYPLALKKLVNWFNELRN